MADTAADFNNPTLELGGKSSHRLRRRRSRCRREWALYGIFRNQGQAGSATSRLLVQQGIAERLLERLVEAVRDICIGPGTEPGVQMGPLVSAARYSQVMEVIAQGRQDARLLTGGRRPPGLHIGYFIEPTVFDEPHTGSPLAPRNPGPVLSVKRFGTEEQAVAMANDSLYGFAAAVMSTDLDQARRVAGQLRVGVAWINCSQPASSRPLGGTPPQRPRPRAGPLGLDNYLEVKQVTEYISEEPWGGTGAGRAGNGACSPALHEQQQERGNAMQNSTMRRGLNARHIRFMALGSAIGTGLFYGSAAAIQRAGPSVLLAYLIAGAAVYLMMRALGEMAVRTPVAGSFGHYANHYLGRFAGFLTGWTYVFSMLMVCLADVTAFGIYMGLWFPDTPRWVWVLGIVFVIAAINLCNVRVFGELEFWLAAQGRGHRRDDPRRAHGAGVRHPPGRCGRVASFANLWAHGGFFPNGLEGMVASFTIVICLRRHRGDRPHRR